MNQYLYLLNNTFALHRNDALKKPILKERILYISNKLRELYDNEQVSYGSLDINEVRSIIKVFEELAGNNERQDNVILKIIDILHFIAENKKDINDGNDDNLPF